MTKYFPWRGVRIAVSAVGVSAIVVLAPMRAASQEAPPRILLDQSARAIDYQLVRLTDDRLARVERRPDDPRYIPVYYALLTRPGLEQALRDEAVAALTALEGATTGAVLLQALGRVTDVNNAVAPSLTRMLLGQPSTALTRDRTAFEAVARDPAASPLALRAAYGARLMTDDSIDTLWAEASARPGQLVHLLESVVLLPTSAERVRGRLVPLVQGLVLDGAEPAVQAAAIHALVALRPDAATFRLLGTHVTTPTDPVVGMAAVRGLSSVPETAWPAASLAPIVRALVDRVAALPPDARVEPDAIDVIQLAERLLARLPAGEAPPIRADLRGLGVRVVRIEAVFEQVSFDIRWFAVEAGKPMQIVFVNPDAMPHNVVVGIPGSLETLGTVGGAMPMPSDPGVLPFVPDIPEVLQATRLVKQGETARLQFVAPGTPGEYVFVCTFPGHWTRMYGVMLVVPDLDAWESAPTVPTDPMTGRPFPSQRH
jgi:hypothetical protein